MAGVRTPRQTSDFRATVPDKDDSHPVKVVLRCRPALVTELRFGANAVAAMPDHPNAVRVQDKLYQLDGVSFAAEEPGELFYRRYVQQSVEDALTGAERTVLMYGPTGTGKTYTMFSSAEGLSHLALRQIMGATMEDGRRISVAASVLEIYNEKLIDLLAPSTGPGNTFGGNGTPSKASLKVQKGRVLGAQSVTSSDPVVLMKLLAPAFKRRTIAATNLNSLSSRSHCILTFTILPLGGRISFVDLAGSESLGKSGAVDEQAKQAGTINQGLLVLRRVVDALAAKQAFIPYRDSKLTLLLQESLGGGSRTLMVLCTSPCPADLHETIVTLHYGTTARDIVQLKPETPTPAGAAAGREASLVEMQLKMKDEMIERLRQQNEELERRLAAFEAARYAPAFRAGYSNALSPEDSDADSSVNGNDSFYGDDDGMSVSSEPLAERARMSSRGRGVPAFVGGGISGLGGNGGSASECVTPTEGMSPIMGAKPKKEWKLEIWRRASKAARAQHNAVNAFRDALSDSRRRSAFAAARAMGLDPPGTDRWLSQSQEGPLSKTLFRETDSTEGLAEPETDSEDGFQLLSRSAEGMLESPAGNDRYLREEKFPGEELEELAGDSGSVLEFDRSTEQESLVADVVPQARGAQTTESCAQPNTKVSAAEDGAETEPRRGEPERNSFLKRFSLAIRGLVTDPTAGGRTTEAQGSDETVSKDFVFDSPRSRQNPVNVPGHEGGNRENPLELQTGDVPAEQHPPVSVLSTVSSDKNLPPDESTEPSLPEEAGQSSSRWTLLGTRHDAEAERWLVAGNESRRLVRSLSQDLASVVSEDPDSVLADAAERRESEHKRSASFDRQQSANLYFDAVEAFSAAPDPNAMPGSVSGQRDVSTSKQEPAPDVSRGVTGEERASLEQSMDGSVRTASGTRSDGSESERNGGKADVSGIPEKSEAVPARYGLHVKVEGRGGDIVGSLEGVESGTTLERLRGLIQERLGERAPRVFGFLMLNGIASAAVQRTQEPSVTVDSLPDFPTHAGSAPFKMVCLRIPGGSRRASADQPVNPFANPAEAAAAAGFRTVENSQLTGISAVGIAARRSSGGRKKRNSDLGDAQAGVQCVPIAEEKPNGVVPRKGTEGRPPVQSKRSAAIEASLTAGATGNRRRSSYSDEKTGPPDDRRRSSQSVSRRASVTRSLAADNRGLAELLPEGDGSASAGNPPSVEDGATSALTSADGPAGRRMERRASEGSAWLISDGEVLTSAGSADVNIRSSLQDGLQKHRQNPAIMKWVKERLIAREKNQARGERHPEQDAMLKIAASRLIGNMEDLWELGPGPLKIGGVI